MPTVEEVFHAAVAHHQRAEFAVAESLYQKILEAFPEHAPSWHYLGLLALQQGQIAIGRQRIERAIGLQPHQAAMHCSLGTAMSGMGDHTEAEKAFRQALTLDPNHVEALYKLGFLLKEAGKLDQAQLLLGRALELDPASLPATNLLGALALEQGDLAAAVAYFQRILQQAPQDPHALNNLGIAWMRQGDWERAISAFQQAIAIAPHFGIAHVNLGKVLLERRQYDQAEQAFRRAWTSNPESIETLNQLAYALKCQFRHQEAIRLLRDAIARFPDQAEWHYHLGRMLLEEGRPHEAVEHFRRALDLQPTHGEAAGALLNEWIRQCAWPEMESLFSKWRSLRRSGLEIEPIVPFTTWGKEGPATPFEQCQGAGRWREHTCRVEPSLVFRHRGQPRLPRHDRLRIGYLSSDYHAHATTWLIASLFEAHDRQRFEVFAYSYGVDDRSPGRQRIERGVDRFVELGSLSDYDAAQRIHRDEIDILVDLKGYSGNARPRILAYRPAPIQAAYLGYPGTMGADFIDYLIADSFVVPRELYPFYTEQIVPLPVCYQINEPRKKLAVPAPSRAACQLPEDAFVFCSFNNHYKFTKPMFDVWMRLLKARPSSVLWLLEASPPIDRNLRRQAEEHGVASSRLIFAPKVSLEEHLARHRCADLFLDTFPIGAHTTASDALRMELPLITLVGKTFASRVAGSLLHHLGLGDWITESYAEYEAQALRLSADREAFDHARRSLGDTVAKSALFDPSITTRHLEATFLAWARGGGNGV